MTGPHCVDWPPTITGPPRTAPKSSKATMQVSIHGPQKAGAGPLKGHGGSGLASGTPAWPGQGAKARRWTEKNPVAPRLQTGP